MGNGNGFTWSQLPGFALPHPLTVCLFLFLCLSRCLSVHVSVACCAFCVSLCAAQLLTVSGSDATTMRHAKMSLTLPAPLTRLPHFINGTSHSPPHLPVENKKKVLDWVCLSFCLSVASIASFSFSFLFHISVCCCGNNL